MLYKEIYKFAFSIGNKLVSNTYDIDRLISSVKNFDAKNIEEQSAKFALNELLLGMKNVYDNCNNFHEINSFLENEINKRILISIYFSNNTPESISEYSCVNLQKVKDSLFHLERTGLIFQDGNAVCLTEISIIFIRGLIDKEINFIEDYDKLSLEDEKKIIEKKYFACQSCGSTKQCKVDCAEANEEMKKLQECTEQGFLKKECTNCFCISCRDICPMCSSVTQAIEKNNIDMDIQVGDRGLSIQEVTNLYIDNKKENCHFCGICQYRGMTNCGVCGAKIL